MRYWLMKSEPADVSIDDLASFPNQTVDWYGVRNYQARNFMRDQMKVGDGVLFLSLQLRSARHSWDCRSQQISLSRPTAIYCWPQIF